MSTTTRTGDWMQTYTGKQFWPLDPRPEEIHIEDIAHSLAHQCRYAGHCRIFFSVAEHSILVAQIAPPELKLHALLHDASEAYLVDLPRPVKPHLKEYKGYETNLMESIATRFNLDHSWFAFVKQYDNQVMVDEKRVLMPRSPAPWMIDGIKSPGVSILGLMPEIASRAFLSLFEEYSGIKVNLRKKPAPKRIPVPV